jgi:hypothetical protein
MNVSRTSYSGRAPLRCKFSAPNGSARIRVSQFPSSFGRDPNAVTVGWDYALSQSENYTSAVQSYIKRAGWAGEYAVALTNDGGVAVYVPGTDPI